MILKSLLAGALAPALSSPSQAQLPPPTFVTNPYIVQIVCLEGKGSGFKLDNGTWVSVNHVTRLTACTIGGKPIHVTYADPEGDISTFTFDDHRKGGLPFDCGGFKDRAWYFGTGYARGRPILQAVPVLYSQLMTLFDGRRGWATMLYNRFIPGESGGPVQDQWGRVVGTVNAYAVEGVASFSRPLKDSPICQS